MWALALELERVLERVLEQVQVQALELALVWALVQEPARVLDQWATLLVLVPAPLLEHAQAQALV